MAEKAYVKGPNAPETAEVVWGGKSGWRLKLRSSFGYGGGQIVIFRRDPFFAVLEKAGIVVKRQ